MVAEKKLLCIADHSDPLARPGGIQSGGQNVYINQLSRALARRGWKIDVFTHWDEAARPQQEYLAEGCRVVRIAAGRRGFIPKDRLPRYLPGFLREMTSYLRGKQRRYSIIHSHYWMSGWLGKNIKWHFKVPLVHTFHSLGVVKARYLSRLKPVMVQRLAQERTIVDAADRVVATTPQERQEILRHYRGRAGRIAVVPCGIDPQVFYPRCREQCRSKLGILPGKKVILFVGRFDRNKGLAVLLDAVAAMVAGDEGWREKLVLLIAGGDPLDVPAEQVSEEKKKLLEQVQRLGLVENIFFLGPIPQEQLPWYYSAADITAVPSYYESFGMVALEAQACGSPVVASRVGGLKYVVRHGETGLTVKPGRPAELAEALVWLLNHPDQCRLFGKQAAARARRHFTWDRAAAEMEKVYLQVIQEYESYSKAY